MIRQRDIVVLETVVRQAPFGLQLWDPVTARTVSDGLLVVTYPPDQPNLRTTAIANRHDVFLLEETPVTVECHDVYGRFLPFTWAPLASSPFQLERLHRITLFSAPTRSLPRGTGVVRAELHEPSGAPAAGALLEVAEARGMADDRGRVVVAVPYPSPPVGPLGAISPVSPFSSGVRLAEQTWTLPVRAAYQTSLRAPAEIPPDIAGVLSQPPAALWADIAQTVPLTRIELHFGRETIVSSVDQGGGPRPSVLVIQPA